MKQIKKFKWNIEGKLEYMKENSKWSHPIMPTSLRAVEDSDKKMYNKLLKGLGWDKMGPNLLRQLKDEIL